MPRCIGWFSCGSTSAVAMKLALIERPQMSIVRIRIASEHPDADRFCEEVQRWLGHEVTIFESAKYADHFDVIEKDGYLNGPSGARCTLVLKRRVREKMQFPGDTHVFGFDANERERMEDFRENNPELMVWCPLIDAGLTKSDCDAILQKAGIKRHAMYDLGYDHANCVGCVKGGMGYWNKIRVDFPDAFAKMAALERKLNRTVIRKGGKPLFLDELDPSAGRFKEDQPGECGVLCQQAMERVGLGVCET